MAKALSRLFGFCVGMAVVGVVVVVVVEAAVTAGSRDRMYSVSSVPTRPVALVLGAQIYPDGTPSPFLKGRLDLAVQLYEQGKVRAILVSGDNGIDHYNEPEGMRSYLVRAGVPEDKVVTDHAGFDTYDSCVRAKRVFGVESLTVVSQEYHVPRAVVTCSMVGVDAVGVGDTTVKADSRTWYVGEVREWLANLKMLWDVGTRRDPVLGPREQGVSVALEN